MLELIANHVSDVVVSMDEEGRVLFVSPSCRRLLHTDPDSLVGASILDFVHVDDREGVLHLISAQAPSDVARHAFRCMPMSGPLKWVEGAFNRIDQAGQSGPCRIVGVLQDITERRATEERLRLSEAQFRGAFESAAHGMALISTDGRWLKVNKEACAIVGYSEAELLATDFQTLTHPADLGADLELVDDLLAGEIDSYQMEKRYFHKDGRIVWVRLSVSLVRDHTSAPVHFVSQIIDITQKRQAEDALCAAKEKADRANRAKSEMLTLLKEESRVPLQLIEQLLADLLSASPTPDQEERLRLIESSVKSLSDIVDKSAASAEASIARSEAAA